MFISIEKIIYKTAGASAPSVEIILNYLIHWGGMRSSILNTPNIRDILNTPPIIYFFFYFKLIVEN